MSFGAPSPPDAGATATAQQGYNTTAAQTQQKLNMVNQTTPLGSLTYAADPNSPGGFSANVNLSPEQQRLLQQQQQNQGMFGNAAGTLAGTVGSLATNSADMYSKPAQIDPSAMTKQLMDWKTSYIQPIFQQQEGNLDAQLRNQGLAPGTEAWNNAQNLQRRNEGDVTNQFFAQSEPLAFNQAVQQYQLPAQTEGALLGNASAAFSPSMAQGPSFQTTPTEQIQPANYSGLVEQNYEQQNKAYGQNMAGLFGIPTALAGGWARGGFAMPKSG